MAFTKADKQFLKETFATKEDFSDIVRQELKAQKPEWIREISESVAQALGEKIDKMYTELDKFIGEIQARRQEQTLHQGQHDRLDERIKKVEKKLNIVPLAD